MNAPLLTPSRHLADTLRGRALAIGFDLVGFARALPTPRSESFSQWLAAGHAGTMDYLKRNVEKRLDPRRLEPWARSLVSVAVNYDAPAPRSLENHPSDCGWLSRYAWGDDYHETVKKRLHQLADAIHELGPEGTLTRVCVDTAPVLDRVWASQAGIGWFGKNTCILNRSHGSFLFLGEVVTSLDLPPDTPETDHCGTCTACIDACPTGAIVKPYVLDGRRCISYLTIELRGPVPEELRPGMGQHVFGCDICQDVCPWNRKSPRTERPEYQPRPGNVSPSLSGLLEMSREDYRARFRHSAVKRARYEGLLRNAAVAAGNSGNPSLLPALEKAAAVDPLVAEHAEWAARRIRARAGQ
ncbi:MAG: tRNA epoxyqueuosine(34) reductase QueG [Planctomycetes bacterium]|nr:tRNA epoxyqueuosine(34) reductase QueG [Planctomycetota bacterium]